MNSPGFPVCKPGAYYVRSTPERELTYDKKSYLQRKRLLFTERETEVLNRVMPHSKHDPAPRLARHG